MMDNGTTNGTHAPTMITVSSASDQGIDLDTLELGLHAADMAVRPILEDIRLLWYNGLPTTDGRLAIGWHIKAGPNPYLDETCGALEAQGMAEKYLVQHKKPDKNGNNDPKPEWHLKRCSLIVLAEGALSPLQMSRSIERAGIAWGWGPEYDDQNIPKLNEKGEQSRNTTLRMRVFVHELYTNGFYSWLPLTLSGYITDYMLEALYEQYKVLDAYAAYRRAKGLNPAATFYTFSLPVVPTGQMVMKGKPPKQSNIFPMKAELPGVIDSNYLKSHLVPITLYGEMRDELVPEAVLWSGEESAKIRSGNVDATALNGAAQTPQIAAGNEHTYAADQDDPLVLPVHVKWIQEHYCQNNAAVVQALCERFGVTELSQLRRSQYKQLVDEKQANSQQ